jgi:hypothetical protein
VLKKLTYGTRPSFRLQGLRFDRRLRLEVGSSHQLGTDVRNFYERNPLLARCAKTNLGAFLRVLNAVSAVRAFRHPDRSGRFSFFSIHRTASSLIGVVPPARLGHFIVTLAPLRCGLARKVTKSRRKQRLPEVSATRRLLVLMLPQPFHHP